MTIAIGMKVSGKLGEGVITKIITKSTGYVEVDYNGISKKEMAFNLTGENGISLKKQPKKSSTVSASALAEKQDLSAAKYSKGIYKNQ